MSKSKQKRDYMLFIEDILTCIEKIERYTSNKKPIIKVLKSERASERGAKND